MTARHSMVFAAAVLVAAVGCNAIAGIEAPEPIPPGGAAEGGTVDVTPFLGTWVSDFPATTDELTGCPGAVFYKPEKPYRFVVTDDGAGKVTGTNKDESSCQIRFRVENRTATIIDVETCTFPFGMTTLDINYSVATFTLTDATTGRFKLSGRASIASDSNRQCFYAGDLTLRKQP